ncbi:MAG: ComEC/Rec2 family competence protein [Microbacteriaceae bacterium]
MTGARDLRLVPPAVIAWLTAGAAIGVRDAGALILVACVALWAACAVVLVSSRRTILGPPAALALLAGAVVLSAVLLHAGGREPPQLLTAAAHSRALDVTVEVAGHAAGGRVAARMGTVPVLLFADALGEAGIGDVLTVRATPVRAEAGDDVAFLLFARDDPRLVRPASGVLAAAGELRARFAAVAARLPGPGAGLLPGLAIGDTSAVSAELDSDMKTSSLSHLTAVSGSNCAVVVGLLFVLAGAAGMPRGARIVVALAGLAGFVVLVTPEPSVIRAAAMAAIALVGLGLSRPGRGIPVLCAAVIVLLVADPWLARSYGFALSVLATGGLVVLAAPIASSLARLLPYWLAVVIAVPVAAQLACQPVLLLLDPSLPLYGVVANVLAEPAAPFATIAGLAGCLLATLVPPLAGPVAALAWVPASWIAAVASFTAGLPGARSPWPVGPVGLVAGVALCAAVVAGIVGSQRVRRAARLCLVLAVIVYTGTLAGTRVATQLGRPADWQFAQCDVGQGDAVLVRDAGQVALIDTGPEPARLAACLDDLGIGRIQLLVLTHYDLDHVGGAEAVVGRVDRVLIGPPSDPHDATLAATFRDAGAAVDQVARGEHGMLGRLSWRVLWPPPRGVEPGNPASVTLLVRPAWCACLSGLFLGDLGEESQLRLLGSDPPGRVDVVKVAHHGSRDQAASLYESVGATAGLIGVGAGNDYGHPTPDLLGILAAVGTAPYRSDLDGLVLVAPGERPGELRIWTARDVAPAA